MDVLKKYMKKVMPFVAQVRDNVKDKGIGATALCVDFDEKQILEMNMEYLRNTLDIESIEIKFTDDESANEKTREDTRPGIPYIVFSVKPSLKVNLENPIPRSGHFSTFLNVSDGDTTRALREKLAKKLNIQEVNAVQIWRFDDPILGPRKIPSFGDYKTGKTMVEDGIISIDTSAENSFFTTMNGAKIELGTNLVYVIE